MKLTKEQFDCIKEYETDFSHALNDGYFRIVNRKLLADYAEIYKSVFKKDSKILNGCNRCVLQDIKLLAKTYFDDKKEYEAQNKAVEQPKEEKGTDAPNTTKTVKKTTKKTNKKK